MIKVQDLSFNYPKRQVLSELNLEFKPGFNVLLGPNGAGKSTLIGLITHLLIPSSGSITCNGLPLATETSAVMALFGVVFQQSTLDLDLTISQNLTYHGALHGISSKTTLANCRELLKHLELDQRLNEKIRQLNGGHRRRVEIVRALAHQPQILLLDEPSVGLDSDSRTLILNYIRQLTIKRKLCVIWTSHLLDEINDDDHLIIMSHGKIVANDHVATLCQQHSVNNVSELYITLTKQGALNAI